jgi:hypothetical protein
LLVCRTMTRPYISEAGPRKSGPMAYAKTKIESINDASTSLVTPNCLEMVERAGATMDEDTGEIRVKEETNNKS